MKKEKYQLIINAKTIDEFNRLINKANTLISQYPSRVYISKTSVATSDEIVIQRGNNENETNCK